MSIFSVMNKHKTSQLAFIGLSSIALIILSFCSVIYQVQNALILFTTLLMKPTDLHIGLHFICLAFYFQKSIDQAYFSQLSVSVHASQAKQLIQTYKKSTFSLWEEGLRGFCIY